MDTALISILKTCTSEKPIYGGLSLTTFASPKRDWWVIPARLPEFWGRMGELVASGNRRLFLAEKYSEVAPLVVCGEVKFEREVEDLSFEVMRCFLAYVVAACQKTAREVLNITDEKQLVCAVLAPNEDDPCLIGTHFPFRIQFPNLRFAVVHQKNIFLPKVKELYETEDMDQYLPVRPSNPSNIFNVGLEAVPIAGNRTTVDHALLAVQAVWGSISGEDFEGERFIGEELDLMQQFDPREHFHVRSGMMPPTIFTDRKYVGQETEVFWMPMILSLMYGEDEVELDEQYLDPDRKDGKATLETAASAVSTMDRLRMTDMDIAKELLLLLSAKRQESETSWLDIGKALFSASDGAECGFNLWRSFSRKRKENENAQLMEEMWYGFSGSPLTVKTIAWMAKEDNPKEYDRWHTMWLGPSLNKALKCLHQDVAEAVYRYFWLEYICSSPSRGMWHAFRGHRWVQSEGGTDMSLAISRKFIAYLEAQRTDWSARCQRLDDGDAEKKKLEDAVSGICTLISKLKTVSFKNQVMRCCGDFFYRRDMSKFFDASTSLLGMANGVLEITDGEVLFRDGRPEDFITKSTGIAYRCLSWEDDRVKEVMYWIRQIFIDKTMCDYFWRDMSTMLRGGNPHKLFRWWVGKGNNSKSKLAKLVTQAFGGYAVDLPPDTFGGGKKNSSAATPELAQAIGSRVGFMAEQSESNSVSGAELKRIRGGDRLFVRALFDNGGPVELQLKCISHLNVMPPIDGADPAVVNSLRIFPFLSKWSLDAPKDEEEQFRTRTFPMDLDFDSKIPRMAPAFIWVLTRYWPKAVKYGIQDVPDTVRAFTEDYWRKNDAYWIFVQECLDRQEEGHDWQCTAAEAYAEFKRFYRETFPQSKVPAKNVFIASLSDKIGPMQRNRWYGYRIHVSEGGQGAAL